MASERPERSSAFHAYVFITEVDGDLVGNLQDFVLDEGTSARFAAETIGEFAVYVAISTNTFEELEETLSQMHALGVRQSSVGIAASLPPIPIPHPPGPSWMQKPPFFAPLLVDVVPESAEDFVNAVIEIADTMTALVGTRSRYLVEIGADTFAELADLYARVAALSGVTSVEGGIARGTAATVDPRITLLKR